MKKKGSAHFEMIMAFTFFCGFVLFLFLSLQGRGGTPTLFESVLEDIRSEFFELNSVEFGSVFVRVEYVEDLDCFSFGLPEDIFDFSYSEKGAIVTDLDGGIVDSGFASGGLDIESGESFFRVKISEDFEAGGLSGCESADVVELGSVIEREVVSYSSLVAMNEVYVSDYEGLRSSLRVPAVFDFGIVVGDLDLSMMPEGGVPEGVEVLARDEVFEVLRSDGSIENVRVNFRVW